LSKENAVDSFVHRHADKITGILSCFDRVILKGYLPISYPLSMEGFLGQRGTLLRDFPKLAKEQSAVLKNHVRQLAEEAGRPIVPVPYKTRKEDYARQLASADSITEGLVCVFTTQEACPSFKVAYGVGRPRLVPSRPRCLVYYFYYLDREFGLLHVRVPSWFPFTLQVYVNGHEWLAPTPPQWPCRPFAPTATRPRLDCQDSAHPPLPCHEQRLCLHEHCRLSPPQSLSCRHGPGGIDLGNQRHGCFNHLCSANIRAKSGPVLDKGN